MSSKNVVITQDTVKRLLKDVRHIMKNPLNDNGIYYVHDSDDMMKGYAMIVGPKDTPYFGGYYFFEVQYPGDYPHSPPKVFYKTNGDNVRFNPNLYTSGKVCVSLLNTWHGEQWTSCQSITTILLTLCTLLCKDPLLNEPGLTKTHRDFDNYTKIIEYKNVEIAVLKMMEQTPDYFPTKFTVFFSEMKDNFHQNKKDLLAFLQEQKAEHPEKILIATSVYNMKVYINYPQLLEAFTAYCKQLDSSSSEELNKKIEETEVAVST